MNIEPRTPTAKNPPEQFAGDVWLDLIAVPHERGSAHDRRHRALRTRRPHRLAQHARGQYLRVTQGVARFGDRDGNIIEVHAGETLYTPPGQDHWHAAAPGCFMEHIAMLESADDPTATTVWKEHVTDDEYNGRTHDRSA